MNRTKYIWVLYEIVDENILADSAGLPNPEIEPIENYCQVVFAAEKSLEETNGIKMVGVWNGLHPEHTINYKLVERVF